MLKIATWNINSVRLRMDNVLRFLKEENPDILALQETKVHDESFPLQPLVNAGYNHTVYRGEKSYNGVAILSKIPLQGVRKERFVNDDTRHIAATLPNGIELHNVYIPAGGDEPNPDNNPKFWHKLAFCDTLGEWFANHRTPQGKLIIVGDMNIAPMHNDVWSHKQLLKVVSHTPVEVEKLSRLQQSLGWVDTSRHFVPEEEKLYSWWSYRNRDWRKSDRGRRLDHIWVTEPLKASLKNSYILKDMRDWERPSDHVPVITELKL